MLGPLLFIIFINGLLSSLSCNAHVYADDVMLLEIGETEEEVNKSLESNLDKVETWGSQWLVEFNEAKIPRTGTHGERSFYALLSYLGN